MLQLTGQWGGCLARVFGAVDITEAGETLAPLG